MTVKALYLILSYMNVIIVKNDEDIFIGNAYNIPISLMDEWVDHLETDHDDLVIILK